MAVDLTLGAEEELHLVDLSSRDLSGSAPRLLSRLPADEYSAEIQRTTVETNTQVVTSLAGLRAEILRLRTRLMSVAASHGLGVAAVGTLPSSADGDIELTSSGRYGRMQEQYRLLVDEQLICGTQIHVGVDGRDLAVQIAQRVTRYLPVLLAISASSPFWRGQDTGYASIRSIIWQRWPSAGATGPLASAREYDDLVEDLIHSGVIADPKMAYFDVRPSSHAPTLELRVCDACPIVDDAVLIAALFRALVRQAERDIAAAVPFRPLPTPIHRAAMWQAARGGLSGNLVDISGRTRHVPAETALRGLLDRLRPRLAEVGDDEEVRELAEALLARGTSADRQRAAYAENGRLDDVVDLVVRETHGPASGILPADPALSSYPSRAGDEAIRLGSRARDPYREVIHHVTAMTTATVEARHTARDAWTRDHGVSFRVDDHELPFAVDLLPRVVTSYEWSELASGLCQRARAIEAFLQDVYTDRHVVADGVLPADIRAAPGWRSEAERLPRGTVRAPVMGFDVVRNEFGGWRVLEDNVRAPSGTAYALAARELMDAVMPDLPRPGGLLDPRSSLGSLRRAVVGPGEGRTGALLSSGPGSGAWYEHRRLARELDLLLVGAEDLEVRHGRVVHRATGTAIHALYLRLDGELVDLTDEAGDAVGARIMEVAASGDVLLANAPGNGIADDKAMYAVIGDLIAYYLGERPAIEAVPTYRPQDETDRRIVLARVGELVTKPVDGQGGHGVLIGPAADAAEVAARRAQVAADPARWVAQEVIPLSLLPTLDSGHLEPRHVDLRAFVHVTGTAPGEAHLAGIALTRVAPARSLLVNSSQGGGAKDTWIIATDAADTERSRHVRTGG